MKIHLIGIGGIGVSALAQFYLSKGHKVTGSDLAASEITDFLKTKGIKIFVGNFTKNISRDLDLVVFSPAVKKDNKEFKQAKKFGIKTISYPEALGELTKEYYTIAVAGAHGKSTTTAMIALVLAEAGLDPTVIVGTKVKQFGNSNFREGKSKMLVIEACEYDSSFLYYLPKIIVVTNVDKEHLDYFKTFANVKKAFEKFIARLAEAESGGGCGWLVYNTDDENIPHLENPKFKTVGYSLSHQDAKKMENILNVPGKHNVSNALAALSVARILAVPDSITFKALSEFEGTWRRFEIVKDTQKITVVSDYAHHPNEISATFQAAREKFLPAGRHGKKRKIWCVFQPHQHQRAFYLFDDFVKTFRSAPIDNIIITDIYDVAGREQKGINKKINSQKLVKKIAKENVAYVPFKDVVSHIKEKLGSRDVLIIMGAGDVYKLADKF